MYTTFLKLLVYIYYNFYIALYAALCLINELV